MREIEPAMKAKKKTRRIGKLELLTSEERQRILVDWNQTSHPLPEVVLTALFEAQVEGSPESTALVFEEERVSYGELNCRANRLAHELVALGVRPDDRVAICVERSVAMVVALLGVLKAGGAYVPLDPAYPVDRLSYMLADSGPVAVLTHGAARETLEQALGKLEVPVLDLDLEASWHSRPETNPDAQALGLRSSHLAYIIYTSGSTGTPKGVMVEHRNVVRLFHATADWFHFNATDIWTLFHSFAFDFSVWEIWGALLHGGRLIVVPQIVTRSPRQFYELLCTQHVTILNQTPSAFRQLIAAQEENPLQHSLRCVVFGGEALNVSLLKPWYERTQNQACLLINMYGITETTVHVTYRELTALDAVSLTGSPIGRRIPDLRIYILDEQRKPVPIGMSGELYVGGAGVGRGYLNRAELTAERFIASPFVAGDRLYKTGDLARYLSDGNIEYLGRNDFQVKIRGFRIELGEIESLLCQHAGVGEAVVVARGAAEDKRLVAYYTAAVGASVEVELLRGHLSATLPGYMVPSAYVRMESFPLSPNGKLDRKALPAPDDEAYVRRGYEAPVGEMEETVARVFAEVLGVERVGRNDSFFELGGHSLMAMRVLSRLHSAKLRIDVRDLFSYPVVQDLAARIPFLELALLPAIERVQEHQDLPLSFAQQRLWFLSQMEGVSEAYHMPAALRLSGTLNQAALQFALDRIVARHEVLRTRFVVVEGEPVQRIDGAEAGFTLERRDLSGVPDQEERLSILVVEEARAGFDLERGPLVRGCLVRLGEQEHALLVTMHHIVSDGWSIGILVKEFGALYAASCAQEVDPLPELSIQYGDYAHWQRQWLGGEALEPQAEYWGRTLSGSPTLLSLPSDYRRPAQQSYAGGRVSLELDRDLTERLKALSQRHGTTLFMTVLSGFAVLLSRLSGEQDVVIGTPVANRTQRETEELIGFFVNMLALRVDFTGQPTVSELLKRVRQTSIGAQAHQELPFEQVVERLKPSRSLAHSPIFQVMFAWQNNEVSDLDLPGLRLSGLESESSVAKFDLTLDLSETDAGIVGSLEYATSLFRSETVERYGQYLVRLLEAMTRGEDERVSQLSMLPAEEREQLLVEWNATEVAYPSESTVHGLFEAQVEGSPESTALVFEEERVSYGELNCRANRLAHELVALGVRPDDRVAICVERSVAMVVALLGVLKAGGAYVPLDPAYPVDRLSYMLADSGPVAVLTHGAARETLEQALGELEIPVLDLDLEASWHSRPETNPDAQALGLRSSHLAYVIYTSGSTGQPKGVMIEHRNTIRLISSFPWLTSEDVFLQLSSLSFDASVFEIWVSLVRGARLIIFPPEKPELNQIQTLIYRHSISVLWLTAALFDLAVIEIMDSLQTVRVLLAGGDKLSPLHVSKAVKAFSGTSLINGYGPTETTTFATLFTVSSVGDTSIPIGRPISNTRIYILDVEGEPVPVGVAGELYIGGAGVARGYLNRAELTAERFVASRFVEGDRLYKTGDLVRYLPDGNIEFVGRNDFQVKIRGFRIELGEIEARLLDHPGVSETVVVAREDDQGDKRLVAYYTPTKELRVEAGILRAHLSLTLPEYMVPSAYMELESFPLSPNGKLDRKALPAPDDEAYVRPSYEAPVGALEEHLATIWSEVLGVERVGRNDSFFDLGGHSLLAVRLSSHVRDELDVDLKIGDIFESPVFSTQAALLEELIFQSFEVSDLS
ncbi:non-ribosomal peptide synthetase [Granulicella mallensis]|nr:non-ribosomal peptide synthetase [Granulicella mallensis]